MNKGLYAVGLGVVCGWLTQSASAVTMELRTSIDLSHGMVHPALLVGFNPQPDPPAPGSMLDLRDATRPRFTWSNDENEYRIVLGFNLNDQPIVISDQMFDGDGKHTLSLAGVGGSFFDITLEFEVQGGILDRASWIGFNPQPDPPKFLGMATGYQFQVDTVGARKGGTSTVTMIVSIRDRDSRNYATFQKLPPGPVLSVQTGGEKVVLSWPGVVGDFIPEESSDITSENWTAVSETPTEAEGNISVSVPFSTGQKFFRLRKQ